MAAFCALCEKDPEDCRCHDEPVGIAAELQVAGGELPVRGADIFNARQETPIARCGCPESRHLREALETIRDIAIEPVESTMIKEIDETARAALRLEPLP